MFVIIDSIDSLCHSIIFSCMVASAECHPTVRPRAREVSGWTDQVKPERDRSLFSSSFLALNLAGVRQTEYWFCLSDYETHSASVSLCGSLL